MIVLDSSAWIECYLGGHNAKVFSKAFDRIDKLIVPAICLHEVYRFLARTQGTGIAESHCASMRLCQVVDLNPELALASAKLGLAHKLPLADSIVYATGLQHRAGIWTQDEDFKGLSGVKYLPKAAVK